MKATGSPQITVIGGGLAGCAAALSAAAAGIRVTLIEQRPDTVTPLHDTELLAEPVGSGDFGAPDVDRASGLLRAELAELGCPLVSCALRTCIGAATVSIDRYAFAQAVTAVISEHPAIQVWRDQARKLPDAVVVLATGPTTWSPLARSLHEAAGVPYSFAYWGRPPLLQAQAEALRAAVKAPAYPGADPSLFLPLTEAEAAQFVELLRAGERAAPPGLAEAMLADETPLAEDLATDDPERLRGRLLSGPRGGERLAAPAALRLVPDDARGERFALADLITALTAEAQSALLARVPALRGLRLVRPGAVHRLPVLPPGAALQPTLQLRHAPTVLVAGTIAGGLGYNEAIATGHVAGYNAARLAGGAEPLVLPEASLTGQLCRWLAQSPAGPGGLVQANFGMLPEVPGEAGGKQERHRRQAERALAAVRAFAAAH